jgi:hypothetical protein
MSAKKCQTVSSATTVSLIALQVCARAHKCVCGSYVHACMCMCACLCVCVCVCVCVCDNKWFM